MSFHNKFLAGLKWTIVGRVASQFVSWTITIYVMRLVAPVDYGLMALAGVFGATFAVLSEIGLGSALVQSKDITPLRLRQILGIVLLSNFTACAFMAFVVAPLASAFFNEPRLQLVIQVIALQFFPAAFAVVPGAMLSRQMAFRGRAIVEFISNLGGALTTLLLAQQGYGVFALVWGSIINASIRAIGLFSLYPLAGMPVFRFSGCGEMLRYGINVASMQLIWSIYSQADALIAGKLLGKKSLGIYSVSMDLASLPVSRIVAIMNQVAFPALSHIQRDGETLGPYLMKGFRCLSLISFPVMWGMSSISPEIVQVLLGEKWIEATMPLSILCLIMPLRILLPLVHSGLHAAGRADVAFRNTCTIAIIMTLTFVAGCQFGLIGLSLGWLAVYPLVFLITLKRSSPFFRSTLSEALINISRPAVISALMFGVVSFTRATIALSPVANLLALIAAGAAAYAALTFAFNRRGFIEAWFWIHEKPIIQPIEDRLTD